MGAKEIFVKSLEMLIEEPIIFLPKLFSTFFSSIIIVLLLEIEVGKFLGYFSNPMTGLVVIFIFLIISTLFGVIASLMVASMVKNRGNNFSLAQSFRETVFQYRKVFLAVLAVIALSLLISVVLSLGIFLYSLTGNLLYFILMGILGISVLLFIGFTAYFLPITLLMENSFSAGFSESMKTSKDNSIEVSFLLLVSLILLFVAFFSSGYLETFGYAGFVVGRLISSVVNTYFFIISPTYYLQE